MVPENSSPPGFGGKWKTRGKENGVTLDNGPKNVSKHGNEPEGGPQNERIMKCPHSPLAATFRRGFTLIDLTMTIAVATVLVGILGARLPSLFLWE